MNKNHTPTRAARRFQADGTLREDALYVERSADQELFDALSAGEYCYVLSPRQIGKSSLRARVQRRLEAGGTRCAAIDLAAFGAGATERSWLYTIAWEAARGLDVEIDLDDIWGPDQQLPSIKGWERFLRALLAGTESPVVLFIDEIDAVLGLKFSTDEFFAEIRSLGNHRDDEALKRLTFCLLGAATPDSLVDDPHKSPFTLGQMVTVNDFTREEASALLPGLSGEEEAVALLDAVFEWTSGHPYMMQRLCSRLVSRPSEPGLSADKRVEGAVHSTFLDKGMSDANLLYADHYLSRERAFGAAGRARIPLSEMLDIYRRLLDGETIPSNPASTAELHLRLSGFVAVEEQAGGPRLRVRNQVYRKVFDSAWAKKKETEVFFGDAFFLWHQADKSERHEHLLKGDKVEPAIKWAHARSDLTQQEAAFLLASAEADSRRKEQAREENAAVAERARKERASRRVTRILTASCVIIAVALGVALAQYRSASQKAREAEDATRAEKMVVMLHQLGSSLDPTPEDQALIEGIRAVAPPGVPLEKAKPLDMMLLSAGLMSSRHVATLEGHTGRINAVAYSPDGERMLTASDDGSSRLWSSRTGEKLAEIRSTPGTRAKSVAFSPEGAMAATGYDNGTIWLIDGHDGRRSKLWTEHTKEVDCLDFSSAELHLLASGSGDGTARVWDSRTGDVKVALTGHRAPINVVTFSRQGSRLLTASDDTTARIWEMSGDFIELKGHTKAVNAAAFFPDGSRVATASADGTARIWDARTGKMLLELRGHTSPIQTMRLSSDGQRLITGSNDPEATARIWNTTDGTTIAVLGGHFGNVDAVSFSPDGSRAVTASHDGNVRFWDGANGKLVATLRGHVDNVVALAFSPDGDRLLTGSWDATARVWETHDGKPLRALAGGTKALTSIAYSKSGGLLLTASEDGTARLWDAQGKLHGATMHHRESITGAVFSPDDAVIATSSDDGTAELWKAADGSSLFTLGGGAGSVNAIVFSPDGAQVATASDDKKARVWDAHDGHLMFEMAHPGRVALVAYSPDGKRLVTASPSGEGTGWVARVWDNHGALIAPLEGHTAVIRSIAFSPDGTKVLTASNDRTARLWSATDGKPLSDPKKHAYYVTDAVFSPAGSQFVTTSWDWTARLWSVEGAGRLDLLNHVSPVISAGYSPDGTRVATASSDGTVRLWSAASGESMAILLGDTSPVSKVSFSPDGRYLATASDDGVARVYAATAEGMLIQACQLLQARRALEKVAESCAGYLQKTP